MKHVKSTLYCILSLLSTGVALKASAVLNTDANCEKAQNTWQPRAFSSYSLTGLLFYKDINVHEPLPQKDEDDMNHSFAVATEYMQSFQRGCSGLGSMPFWSGSNTMTIGNNSGEYDVDAYQFGMGDMSTPGQITINPTIQQFGSEMFYYYQQCKRGPSFVAKVYFPVSAIKMGVTIDETPAVLDYDETLNLANTWLEYPSVNNLYSTLSDAFHGGGCCGVSSGLSYSGTSKPIILDYGRISPCNLTKIGIGDLSVVLGLNAVNKESGFFMMGVKATLPTSPTPQARYMFEPILGRGGHLGVGVEMAGAYKGHEWKNAIFDVYVQGEALHLLNGRTPSWRTFDLAANGPGSKYLLTQFYFPANPSDDNPTGRVPSFITQAANITTMPVKSSFSVEGSFAALVNVHKCNWSSGLGVEVWGRATEKLSIDSCLLRNYDKACLNDFAVLGRQISVNSESDTALNLCQPLARINKSADVVLNTTDAYDTREIKDARLASNRIPADLNTALDICGAAQPGSVSGKVMLFTGYNWKKSCFNPNVTIFGAFELANRTASNYWSAGIKGSLNF